MCPFHSTTFSRTNIVCFQAYVRTKRCTSTAQAVDWLFSPGLQNNSSLAGWTATRLVKINSRTNKLRGQLRQLVDKKQVLDLLGSPFYTPRPARSIRHKICEQFLSALLARNFQQYTYRGDAKARGFLGKNQTRAASWIGINAQTAAAAVEQKLLVVTLSGPHYQGDSRVTTEI